MKEKFINYSVQASIRIPKVPNFLIMENGQKISIADLEVNGLRKIGELWTEALCERALEIRRDRVNSKFGETVDD